MAHSSDDDDEEELWTPRGARADTAGRQPTVVTPAKAGAAAGPLRRRWNLPALACLTALMTSSTLSFHWRFMCYCFAALPAVPRRPFRGESSTTAAPELFPMQTSAISCAGAVRAITLGAAALGLQVLLPACTLGICLRVDRGQDQTLDASDIWNHVDTDGDGALSADELLPLSADITSMSVLVLLVTSIVTSAVLGWRLHALARTRAHLKHWQSSAQAELRRITAEQMAAEGSLERLGRGELERTKSGEATEREIRSLEDELQELTEEDPDAGATATISTGVSDEGIAASSEKPVIRLKRSVSEKERQRAVMLQERLRKARAEKSVLRDQAECEREQREKAEISLQAARERLAAANRQLAEAQHAAEEEEQARNAAAAQLEAEPAYQLLSSALPLPPSWRLFNWERPTDQGDIHLFIDLSVSCEMPHPRQTNTSDSARLAPLLLNTPLQLKNVIPMLHMHARDCSPLVRAKNVARIPKEDRAGSRPPTHKLNPQGLVSVLIDGREGRLGARHVVGSVEQLERRDEILKTWRDQVGDSWRVALELRVAGHGENFVDDKLHALILNTIMREELQLRRKTGFDGYNARTPTLVLVSGDGNPNNGGSTFPECCAYALQLGWAVEVWAWKDKTSSAFKRLKRRQEYRSAITIHRLDEYETEIIER